MRVWSVSLSANAEIERVYEKIFKGEIEEFPALAEEEKKVEISPQDEKKLQQDDQYFYCNRGDTLRFKRSSLWSRAWKMQN
jgi:hypothetical protein